ncbi:hypothetical protein CRYUN_Cryun25bG0023900 [Craigia yunnanensis]
MWNVATAIGAVERLKDERVCRWNHIIKSVNQHAKNTIRAFVHAKMLFSSSYSLSTMVAIFNEMRYYKVKKSELAMEIVLHMSYWGRTTTRF